MDGIRFTEWDPDNPIPGRDIDIVRLLPPALPSKIIALGLNYRDHAREMGLKPPEDPILFMKPATSVIGPGDTIIYPDQSTRVDYEAELAVVILRQCRNIRAIDAESVILGYTCFNDVTARDLQAKDGQWTRAKSFDTFAPLGPWIETDIKDPHTLAVQSRLNGEIKQSSNTNNLIFNVFKLIEFISSIMTLEKWDVIATGTPSGIGPMVRGDEIAIEIEGIGTLTNRLA
ncbi:MAG: fumarylacetoacetate hydrolase family protein [Desulfomonilia bacterium]|jgi:2-keto-4-pentenoate hydratase/2-oxohepta-3-ene-1,7-dioic acid hydratase in catechol pathway